MYSMHVYISGSGTFALLRYIYVQAFGYCRFLEKLENMLHSQEPIAVSEFFFEFLRLTYVHSDRTTLRVNNIFPPLLESSKNRAFCNRCSEMCEFDK